jgi:GNAT superfamily N-acetyltransferase
MSINYKTVGYFDLYPNKIAGCKKTTKSKFFRKMKELYERGFKKSDFKKSASSRSDIAVLMYKDSTLVGFVFIKEEDSDETRGITDPFFYNLVIDSHRQGNGYGGQLFQHIKDHYPNRALYCLTDNTDTSLHEWYDRRGGLVYNNPDMEWPDGYFVFKFPNGSVHEECEPSFTKTIKESEEHKEKELLELKNSSKTIIPDHDTTIGDDLLDELDDICDLD